MNANRTFSRLRIQPVIVLFLLGLMLMPAAVRAQSGWHPQTLPPLEQGVTYRLYDIKALNANEAWIAGGLSTYEALVLKTTNGASWNLIFRKGDDADPWIRFSPFYRLSLVDSNTAWVGGGSGMTAFTGNGGSSWSREAANCDPVRPAYPPIWVYALKAVNATNVWTGGWDDSQPNGPIWHRPYTGKCNDGALGYYLPYRLETIQGAPILAIDAADADNAWAVFSGSGGIGILHTANGGDSWTPTGSPTGGYLYDVAVVNAGVAWVAGAGGGIAKTSDGGSTWVVQGSGVAEVLRKISAVDADVAWAVGDNGTIVKTVDGGVTWRSQVSGTNAALVGVAAVDANTAWVVGEGILLATTDGGTYQPLSAPGISGVSPAGGPIAGGTAAVFVYGRDFLPGARVYFGGVPAAGTEYRTPGELMVTTPAHEVGIVDVTVVNPDGQSATRAKAFAFADTQPLIVGLNPSYGYLNTEAVLDIYGAGLTPAKGTYEPVPRVSINGTDVAGAYADYDWVQVVLAGSVLTAPGVADVTVTTAAGTSNTLKFAINPGFVEFQKPSTPPYDSVVTIPSLSDPIQATFYGLNQSGSVRVGKAFDDPQWIGYNSPPPTGYRLLPAYHYDVATYSSYLNYQAATLCFPYTDSDLAAAGLDESRLRLMRYNPDNYPTWEDITVTLDPAGNRICGTSPEPMTYFALAQGPQPTPPPAITSIVPAISPPGGGGAVTINGRRFPAGATVTFGGVAAANVTVVNGIKITATIPPHDLGLVDVVVTGPDSQVGGTFAGGFEYVGPPTVTSLTPSSGHYDTEVTITGSGFRNDCTITFGGETKEAAVITDTTITVYAPSHTAGLVDVVVTNADGQSGTLANAFTYVPAPTLAYVEPNAGPVEGGTAVTIQGTGFQTGAIVTFDSTEATGVVVVNPTTIAAVTPASTEGKVDVAVFNPDGQSATSGFYGGFTYGKSPSIITWANPASIPYGTKLSAAQLNATANVEGTFTYSPAAGTTPTVGTKTLTVYFNPTDADVYPRAQKNVSLVVLPALGDLNADGVVNVVDAILVLQTLSAKNPSQSINASADVNGDGVIGMADAVFILQRAASIR